MKKSIFICLLLIAPAAYCQINDQCTGAITVTCGNTYTGTTTASTNTNDPTTFCTTSVDGAGVWYVFAGTGLSCTASLCGSLFDTKIHVYSGSCGSYSCVDGNDDNCGLQSQITFNTVVGTNYYIFISGYGGATGDYTLTIGCPPANDQVAGHIHTTCGNTYSGSTLAATSTNDPSTFCGNTNGSTAAGVWYEYVNGAAARIVTVDFCNAGTTYDTQCAIYTGPAGGPYTCVDGNDQGGGACVNSSKVVFSAAASTSYWIFVYGSYGATGSFQFSISCCAPVVPGCATIPSPANGATGVNPCNVIQSWTAPVIAGCNAPSAYDVYIGTTPAPPFFKTVTGTSLDSPGALIDNTLYYWKVVPKNIAGSAVGCPTWTFTTGATSNPNYCFTGNSSNAPGFGANCAEITPELNGMLGCVWNRGMISFASAFDYSISVYFGNNINGADGCSFVFQNSPAGVTACGNTGGQLGSGGIPNAVVIEFDTYDNDFPMHVYDWGNDHTAIEIDGDLQGPGAPLCGPVDARPGGLNLDDGNMHVLRVTWDPVSKTLSVYIDASLRLSCTNDFVANVFGGNSSVHWGFTGSTGGLNNLQYFCPTTIPLPVELIDFNAKCNDNKVFVNWSTASETNCDFYTIERTMDGVKFEAVGTITGAGNSNHTEYYSWTDMQPVGDNSYYRLRQTDFDGKTKTYSLVSVVCNSNESLLSFTNTFVNDDDRLNVGYITSQNGNHSISIYDMLGNLVSFSSMDVEAGQHEIKLNTQNLNRGLYLLNITNGLQTISRKIQFIK